MSKLFCMSSIGLNKTNYHFTHVEEHNLVLQEKHLADKLSSYLVNELNLELRYNRSATNRMVAAKKLVNYCKRKNEMFALIDAYRYDENPNVRAAAKYSLSNLLKR